MGTQCEIQLFVAENEQAKGIAELVIADVQRLEGLYSRYRCDSLLSRINKVAAKGGRITVDEETAGLLDYAATCYQQSDGLFDITSGILRQAWRFESGQLPDDQLIKALLKKVGWHKLHWRAPVLEFRLAGMELDFGGIVKEYAVDRAAAIAWNAGARHGFINLGGDLRLIGPRPDGTPWQVGIHHPRQKQALATTLALHNGAVASSGDYERCIIVNGQRYGHILNPKTGWPVRHLASVSVVGEFCVVAGSASTIAMLKEEQGPDWLEQLALPYLWIDVHGNSGGSLAVSDSTTR
ncbi:FAD:protein FMN transferase [Methylomonas methanica]|uniref:FAD:protein FMN transferase n=1 Tax=Methylomonas methanica TaxID=421 RepID=A0A177M8J4_METMH|nr:FAD:protein FMN transferase [Methylomonas methanica]OAI01099.1 thiamine biosynthesis protein ApbE [Methylomonas methanica]